LSFLITAAARRFAALSSDRRACSSCSAGHAATIEPKRASNTGVASSTSTAAPKATLWPPWVQAIPGSTLGRSHLSTNQASNSASFS